SRLDLRGFQQIVERIACHQRISRCEAKFSQLFLRIVHIIKRGCCVCFIPCACTSERCVVRCFPTSIRVVVVCVDCIIYCSERNFRRSCIGSQKLHPHRLNRNISRIHQFAYIVKCVCKSLSNKRVVVPLCRRKHEHITLSDMHGLTEESKFCVLCFETFASSNLRLCIQIRYVQHHIYAERLSQPVYGKPYGSIVREK